MAMAAEVLATTAGVGILMAVLPRALFALRLGRTEGLSPAVAMGLMLAAGLLTMLGAWRTHLPAVAANVAAVASCAAYLVLADRCQDIQAERRAIAAQLRGVRPTRRVRARL